jgi:hypothetical protein
MTTKQTPTPTAANIYAELCACCETLPAPSLARLEISLRAAGLVIAADLVQLHGYANCGIDYDGYLAAVRLTKTALPVASSTGRA